MQIASPLRGTVGLIQPQEPTKYCLYARKSSEAEEKQALSIDSQVKEMLLVAQREQLEIVEIYRESHSAKACGQRSVFNQLLADVREGKFTGILVWHPDRLSRNAGDLGSLVDLMDQKKLVEIRTHSQRFTNNPNEKFLLMILGSQAKLENDNKSINVKRGLKMKCELGLWPSVAPTGYLNSKNKDQKAQIFVDPVRSPVIKQMFEKVAQDGWGGRKIFAWLKQIEFVSRSGKPLTLSNVYTILSNHFYYGTFEYPKNSGNWYQGLHTPIINKDLFNEVRDRLRVQRKVRGKNKEFAFTRLMKCGLCGSGISAEEKYKNLSDGTIAKYIYYGCTRFYDKDCKGGYLEEKQLLAQLLGLIEAIDLDKSGLRKKLGCEIERHKKFHSQIMGKKEEEYRARDADIRNYAKYLLEDGLMPEKRELMSCLKSRLILREKTISLI